MAMLEADYSALGVDRATQELIAPVLLHMVADRAFAVGDQFICQSTLYKITTAVTLGTTLTVGTNCELSDTITQQIPKEDTWHQFDVYTGIFYKKSLGVVTIVFNNQSFDTNTNITLTGELPAGYRPTYNCNFMMCGSSIANTAICIVYTTGKLLIYVTGSSTTNLMRGTATYVV